MKLLDVWNAVATSQDRTVSPWGALARLKKPPKVAYRLMKYGKDIDDEYNVIDRRRIELVHEAAGVEEGQPVKIEPDSPEFSRFAVAFNEFLDGESDLKPVGIGMDALIDALDSEKGNVLSEQDLALVAPFFQEKAA